MTSVAELRARLAETPILPVMAIKDADEGLADIDGLVAAGAPVIEILFRTPEAPAVLKAAKARYPHCLFGAGTMLLARHVRLALDAGADFTVSPGLTPALQASVAASGLPHIPGVQTASETMQACEYGYSLMKYYPSEASNGPVVLADYANIFEGVGFVTTGGIETALLPAYGAVRNIVAVGGSWMLPSHHTPGSPCLQQQAAIFKAARAAIER
ncbi:bifunctional 4-hydroxy-2-oxoglutarate aldolase/2-dehydro-3-deoxy-phosphogluconate aldolase [Labrys sp. LIt4]|uniref:bifunctional 4-hydroxy-2-oxoglutarate aldolase/2-dehydro-3-deoxy-phosphogluconate aldolase n=1 Tax=Labrys sp. LIt4 TaxID=2821355 RepID=UPI001AE03CCD|nr:bifunctional 4-hydroxy-2-oxoglutarate aldolase/2-dehydro-3-deoxy-phosphogluconate aldolase [Labrys sp. LIt4]MBP0581807.1 bifunctional 4-hydroxy-2-oxoglutarate aldolase/2-dehydro-3-deoxy-phosphogluconate aldolase [Labrys sp. LIt4]